MLFRALLPQTIFSLTSIKVLYVCSISVLKDHLQAMQNGPQCRFHWHGAPLLLCSVGVFIWICMSIAEIQVYALTRQHTDSFG